jgi:hypothetical protein
MLGDTIHSGNLGMEKINIDLRAVVYREGDWWIAHCLELDLVAEGKTPQSALKDLIDLSTFQIQVATEEGDLESVFRPAPAHLWAMYASAEEIEVSKRLKKPIRRLDNLELTLA